MRVPAVLGVGSGSSESLSVSLARDSAETNGVLPALRATSPLGRNELICQLFETLERFTHMVVLYHETDDRDGQLVRSWGASTVERE